MALKWVRLFPNEHVESASFDVEIKNDKGNVVFVQKDVQAPATWSQLAVTVVANKYFRGNPGEPDRETSVFAVIERIIQQITEWAIEEEYFEATDYAYNFKEDLRWILLNQLASFNSPVWFNFGIKEEPQQGSACFIMHVEDDMQSIINRQFEESILFKSGSGAGCNNSRLRGSMEALSNGGYASGPVSFMRGYDGYANIIRSGGKTRRAAKMEFLDVDHPDILEFVNCKPEQEEKARVLKGAGFGGNGINQINEVFFQNANLSVRVNDEFMEAVKGNFIHYLVGRKEPDEGDIKIDRVARRMIDGKLGRIISTHSAQEIWDAICLAAWKCGDPGIGFHDNINEMHTLPHLGPIESSNPCGEFLHPNYTACNLGSLNLPKFFTEAQFLGESFDNVVKTMALAMDIIAGSADYPCDSIAERSRRYRPLGLGYTGVGHLCMMMGYPYDSDKARTLMSYLTARMTGGVYRVSTTLMEACGFEETIPRGPIMNVIQKHIDNQAMIEPMKLTVQGCDMQRLSEIWNYVLTHGAEWGYRNSQATVIAPTGTISFGMDMGHSTGVEPLIMFNPKKNMSDSGIFILDSSAALQSGLDALVQQGVIEHIEGGPTAETVLAGNYNKEFYHNLKSSRVFQTALKDERQPWIEPVSPDGHLKMMAAIQPFISGGISKTVNLPEETTVEDVGKVFVSAWEMGLKCIALYRDNSKFEQVYGKSEDTEPAVAPVSQPAPVRVHLPDERPSTTHKVKIGEQKFYLNCGTHPDTGKLMEIFVTTAKEGSTVRGLMDTVATLTSICLQYGVPLDTLVNRFRDTRFEPHGMTSFREIPITLSPVDYIFKYLELRYLNDDDEDQTKEQPVSKKKKFTGGICNICGSQMQRSGRCYVCSQCGETTGCG